MNALQKKIAAYQRSIRFLNEKLSKARTELKRKGCSHPSQYREKFTWTHDNGYGKQSQCEGVRCSLCECQNYYPEMSENWSNPYWEVY